MDLLRLDGATRLHAIEAGWLDRVRNCRLYAYTFDSSPFRLKLADAGYWVAQCDVNPIAVSPVGDLLARHADAEIELRIVPNLWRLIDAIINSGLEFSIIRKANARPRDAMTWRTDRVPAASNTSASSNAGKIPDSNLT